MLALADCAVVVTDAKQTARWWNEKLGFAIHTVGPGDHAIMIAPPGDHFILHLCEGFAPVEPGNTGIAFVTDEIGPLVQRMVAGGVAFPEPLKKESWGAMAKFSDPDGNVFWLIEAPTSFLRAQVGRAAPRGRAMNPQVRRTPVKRKRAAR